MLWKVPLDNEISKSWSPHCYWNLELSFSSIIEEHGHYKFQSESGYRSSNSNSENGSPWKYLKSYTAPEPCSTSRNYCQTSNIWLTKSQHLKVSCLALQLSLPHPLKLGFKSRMKMYLEQRRQAMLQLHLSDQNFIAYWYVSYIRGLTLLQSI